MVTTNVSFARHEDRLRCEVHGVPGWEGLDKLVRFLEKHYEASVVDTIDGPDARCCRLQVGGSAVEIQYEDPWGSVLVAVDREAEEIVRRIGEDLRERLDAIGS